MGYDSYMATDARRFAEQPREGLPVSPEGRERSSMLPDELRGTLHINMHERVDAWIQKQARRKLLEDPETNIQEFMRDFKKRPLSEVISAMLVDESNDPETAGVEERYVEEWKASVPEGTETPQWIQEIADRVRRRKEEAAKGKPN